MIRDFLPQFRLRLEGPRTIKGKMFCKECGGTFSVDVPKTSYWICPGCAEKREKRIQAHIRRIRSNPLWRAPETQKDDEDG
jgi:ribosomal protein L37AE/L43A